MTSEPCTISSKIIGKTNETEGGHYVLTQTNFVENRYLEDEMVESGESGCLDRISSQTHWERVTSLDGGTQSA